MESLGVESWAGVLGRSPPPRPPQQSKRLKSAKSRISEAWVWSPRARDPSRPPQGPPRVLISQKADRISQIRGPGGLGAESLQAYPGSRVLDPLPQVSSSLLSDRRARFQSPESYASFQVPDPVLSIKQ